MASCSKSGPLLRAPPAHQASALEGEKVARSANYFHQVRRRECLEACIDRTRGHGTPAHAHDRLDHGAGQSSADRFWCDGPVALFRLPGLRRRLVALLRDHDDTRYLLV
jgi:hypothetical protein